MAEEGYLLSEAFIAKIRELINDAMRKGDLSRGSNRQNPGYYSDESPSPPVHIAFTPIGGIPALHYEDVASSGTGTGLDGEVDPIPGSATCKLYRIRFQNGEPILRALHLKTRTVYNVSETSVPGEIFTPVWRDKAGHWLALGILDEEVVTGTGTGTGSGSAEDPTTIEVVTCVADGKYTVTRITLPAGSTTEEIGCFPIGCDDCDETGTGTGTGSEFTGTTEVPVGCTGEEVPATLIGTVTNKTGGCTCVPDTIEFLWDGSIGWEGSYSGGGCACNLTVFCVGTASDTPPFITYEWQIAASCKYNNVTLVSETADPFELVFDIEGGLACSGTFTLTITPEA